MILDPNLEDYSKAHSSPEPDYLRELRRASHRRALRPRMLSGPLQGRFLAQLSKLLQAQRILEVGTYTGYSALCLAEGLTPEGALHTIEINDELASIAQPYFQRSGKADRIHQHLGNALDILPHFEETWDLIFVDADKENYLNYYKLSLDQLRPGGLFIADNVLWSGKVTEPAASNDRKTQALQEFNTYVHADERVSNLLLPLRDGLMLLQKLF